MASISYQDAAAYAVLDSFALKDALSLAFGVIVVNVLFFAVVICCVRSTLRSQRRMFAAQDLEIVTERENEIVEGRVRQWEAEKGVEGDVAEDLTA